MSTRLTGTPFCMLCCAESTLRSICFRVCCPGTEPLRSAKLPHLSPSAAPAEPASHLNLDASLPNHSTQPFRQL